VRQACAVWSLPAACHVAQVEFGGAEHALLLGIVRRPGRRQKAKFVAQHGSLTMELGRIAVALREADGDSQAVAVDPLDGSHQNHPVGGCIGPVRSGVGGCIHGATIEKSANRRKLEGALHPDPITNPTTVASSDARVLFNRVRTAVEHPRPIGSAMVRLNTLTGKGIEHSAHSVLHRIVQ
jgi:hypothetical protein